MCTIETCRERLTGNHDAKAKDTSVTKARLLYIALIVVLALSISAPVSAGGPPPPTTVTFTLLTPLPTDLAVGEEYVVAIQVESAQPFNMAMTRAAVYYPAYVMDF